MPAVTEILPAPFEWKTIPAGSVTLVNFHPKPGSNYLGEKDARKSFELDAFSLARYPVTRGQFKLFMDAGGYQQQAFWTEEGWEEREKKNWTEPFWWQDPRFDEDTKPVAGICFYEALAFCEWLSQLSGETVTLPTEAQWQRAAQGDDERIFPWGMNWEAGRCNSMVGFAGIQRTSPVQFYEDKNESPFGIVDMVGNVFEWTLTDYETGENGTSRVKYRVCRGGSWMSLGEIHVQTITRVRIGPQERDPWAVTGFRIARNP